MLKLKDLKGTYKARALFVTDHEFQGLKLIAENADKIADMIKAQVEKQGCADFKREGSTCHYGNQFFNLPRIPAERKGELTFRSADYHFSSPDFHNGNKSYGKKPKAAQLTGTGFIIESLNGHIEYILEEKKED